MRLVVGAPNPHTLRVDPDDMRAIMLDQIHHGLLQYPIRGVLRQRKDMFRRIDFFLVDTTAFDTDGIYEQRDQFERHLHFVGRFLGRGGRVGGEVCMLGECFHRLNHKLSRLVVSARAGYKKVASEHATRAIFGVLPGS